MTNPEQLIEETRALIRRSSLTYPQIALETGFSDSWIGKFMRDQFEDYGHRRLLRLNAFLKAREACASAPSEAA